MRNNKINMAFALTILFNILFPKAGIKLGTIPLNVGMVLFLLCILLYMAEIIRSGKLTFTLDEIIVCIGILFWLIRIGTVPIWAESYTLSGYMGYLISLTVFACMFMVFRKFVTNEVQMEMVVNIIEKCVILIIIYSLLQYLFGIGTVTIPGVTVNYSDYAQHPTNWWRVKLNGWGDSNKMPSTYQNGNLFGIALIQFFPLAYRKPNKKISQKVLYIVMFIAAVFIAGSRSVYIGIVLGYAYIFMLNRNKKLRIKKSNFITGIILLVPILIIMISVASNTVNEDFMIRIMQLFNWETLIAGAGRTRLMSEYMTWLANENSLLKVLFGGYGFAYDGSIYEMLYCAMFLLGGILGVIVFMVPLIYMFIKIKKIYLNEDWILKGAFEGLVLYLITAIIEGGYWLVPTALNFWTLISIAYFYVYRNEKRIRDIN